jgi:hypothetical protein
MKCYTAKGFFLMTNFSASFYHSSLLLHHFQSPHTDTFTDSVAASEAAGYAMGLVMLGSADPTCAEMLTFECWFKGFVLAHLRQKMPYQTGFLKSN